MYEKISKLNKNKGKKVGYLSARNESKNVLQKVVATGFKYMGKRKRGPRFTKDFATKHILNSIDSDLSSFNNTMPLNKDEVRVNSADEMTRRAYVQAMNRFNSPFGSATVTIMEPTDLEPKPGDIESQNDGIFKRKFSFSNAWVFERVANDKAPPNYTRWEAKLVFSRGKGVAKVSCMDGSNEVNHWNPALNKWA